MAPTRELALQIDVEFQKLLSRQSHVVSCAIVGGQPIQKQAQKLRDGVTIVVGTPGRINDCLEMAYLVLNQCCYIVLDEADRMIDVRAHALYIWMQICYSFFTHTFVVFHIYL
jgi:ATP-dependent RNA helicase DDX23/PRP28